MPTLKKPWKRKTRKSPEAKKLYASRTSDQYFIDLNPQTPFANMSIDCPGANYNPNAIAFNDALDDFALESGLDAIERVYNNKRNQTSNTLRTQFKNWKDNPVTRATQAQLEAALPALSHPLTLYRNYKWGINGTQPVAGSDYDIGSQCNFLSFSTSLAYIHAFGGSVKLPESIYVRLDAMPGTYIVPFLRRPFKHLQSEFEVLVPNFYRVHVFDPKTVQEGRVPASHPPLTFGCHEMVKTAPLPLIDYFFIMSLPGTVVDYSPDYRDPSTRVRLGGSRKLRLHDGNQLGVGNVHDLIHRFMNDFPNTQ